MSATVSDLINAEILPKQSMIKGKLQSHQNRSLWDCELNSPRFSSAANERKNLHTSRMACPPNPHGILSKNQNIFPALKDNARSSPFMQGLTRYNPAASRTIPIDSGSTDRLNGATCEAKKKTCNGNTGNIKPTEVPKKQSGNEVFEQHGYGWHNISENPPSATKKDFSPNNTIHMNGKNDQNTTEWRAGSYSRTTGGVISRINNQLITANISSKGRNTDEILATQGKSQSETLNDLYCSTSSSAEPFSAGISPVLSDTSKSLPIKNTRLSHSDDLGDWKKHHTVGILGKMPKIEYPIIESFSDNGSLQGGRSSNAGSGISISPKSVNRPRGWKNHIHRSGFYHSNHFKNHRLTCNIQNDENITDYTSIMNAEQNKSINIVETANHLENQSFIRSMTRQTHHSLPAKVTPNVFGQQTKAISSNCNRTERSSIHIPTLTRKSNSGRDSNPEADNRDSPSTTDTANGHRMRDENLIFTEHDHDKTKYRNKLVTVTRKWKSNHMNSTKPLRFDRNDQNNTPFIGPNKPKRSPQIQEQLSKAYRIELQTIPSKSADLLSETLASNAQSPHKTGNNSEFISTGGDEIHRQPYTVVTVRNDQVEEAKLKWSWNKQCVDPQYQDFLTFASGETVDILAHHNGGWTFGRIRGNYERCGWFPTYMLQSPPSETRKLIE